ncbi:MAG: glycosyltransferase [Fimbriimonadaceae bacterium]|nr:glycosyltransferase [Fimbriimonadaceae bacterium]
MPWHGEAGDWQGAAAIVEAAGGTVIVGDWRSEDDHRRAALAWLSDNKYSHALIPDGDEIIEPNLLRSLVLLADGDLADAVHVEWDTYWKSPEYVIRPRERFKPLILLKVGCATHVALRHYDAPRTLQLNGEYGIIHHLSYVGSDARIARKISTWSHRGELVPNWWEGIWLAWDRDRLLENLHPTHPAAYGSAVRIPVPKPLASPELANFVEARRTPHRLEPDTWPAISVIIPTCGQSPVFAECLDSLEACKDLLGEIIVVQDGPCPGLRVPKREPFQCLRSAQRGGFAAACNKGTAKAKGEIVLFLNDDAVLTRAGLIELVRPLLGRGTIAATGAMSNRCGHFQQTNSNYESLEQVEGFAIDFAARPAQDFETDMLVGLCLAVRKHAFDEVGQFDESFGLGTFEDNDLCYRLRRAGYRLVVAARSYVHHEGSSTLTASGGDVAALLARNEQKFRAKWAQDIEIGYASHLSGLASERIMFKESRHPDKVLEGIGLRAREANISLCMIVKDEERVLGDCLKSARPFFSQIVVVDTGSTDRTMEIALEHGAQLHEFPWTESFSEARNESLRHATGKWIFWMDADDTLPWSSGEALIDTALSAAPGVAGFIVPVQFVDSGPAAGTRVDHVKLFRRFEGAAFEFRIHEQILRSIRNHGGQVERCPAYVLHSGYDTSEAGQAKKRERDWTLLRLDFSENPNHPFVLFNIGMTHHYQAHHAKAVRWLKRCIARCVDGESILRKAYSLAGISLRELGRKCEAFQMFSKGLEAVGPDPELHFQMGLILTSLGRVEEAKEQYRKALTASVEGHLTSIDVGIQGYRTWHNLGVLCLESGDYNGAREHFATALELAPQHLSSARILFDAAIKRGDYATSNQMLGHVGTATGGGEMWAEMLAIHAGAIGGYDNDLHALRSELHRNPSSLAVRLVLARRLVAREQLAEAVPHFEALTSVGCAEGTFMLGVHHLQKGNVVAARALLERALVLNPGHKQTEEYLQTLSEGDSQNTGTTAG